MFSMDPTNESTKGHVDGRGEECRTEQNEHVGDNVWSHCSCVIMCNAPSNVTDYLDLIVMQVSVWSSRYRGVKL
jgi:hypothetical protein